MGDFLSRLAERTLETAPVAKPVIAPAFAPGIPPADQGRIVEPEERGVLRMEGPPRHAYPPPAAPVPGEPPMRHDDVAGRTRLPVAPQPLPGPLPRRADDERRVEEPRTDRIARHDDPRPAPIEVRIIEREIESRPEPRRSDRPDDHVDAGREHGFLLPPIPPEPPREARGNAGREERVGMEIAREAARERSEAPREGRDGPEPAPSRHEEAPRREPPAPRPLVAIESQPVRPRAERLDPIPGEGERRREQPAPSQPQTIQVTIGRIEVRATTTATTRGERRERQGAQVMSIDDYLRQRTGGGR